MVNKMTPKVSICIPTWEQKGFGVKYLSKLLDTVKSQTYKDLEVVISDHSINDDILNLVKNYSKDLLINYVRNHEKLGNSPFNTNNSIINSKGEIIKVMFQDDFFFDNNALEIIISKFNDNVMWVVNGCNHTDSDNTKYWNYMIPRWNDSMYRGVNTISSPSVLSFRRDVNIRFDDNLVMLMDCEIYHNFYTNYGLPVIVTETLVTNRLHNNQISTNYKLNINDEINYVKKKYNIL
jgi:glycosyltransferase involved in cell wall biosynthesis